MTWQPMPGNVDAIWGIWIWVLAFIAGVLCHSPQSSLADYYRQIHLLFLNGKEGSELDTYANQRTHTPTSAQYTRACLRAVH